jgi:hypothetical protein
MKSTIYLLSFFLIALTSCSNDAEQIFEADGIYIRIENVSDYKINNIIFSELDFGKVKKNKKTLYDKLDYLAVYDMQNPLVSYEISFNWKTLEQGIGFCGMGVRNLEAGKYTIEVDFSEDCSASDCYPLFQIVKD